MEKIRIKRFRKDIILPSRAYTTDAGLDFYAPEDISIAWGTMIKIPCGFGIALEQGYVGLFFDRSSIGARGLRTLGGVIDANYRGEISIMLANVAGCDFEEIKKDDKIAQLIITKAFTPSIEEVEEFEITDRNHNGFGSTGS